MKYLASTPAKFLRISGFFFFLMIMSFAVRGGDAPKSFNEGSIHLNPQCKIKRMSNGEVYVIATNREGAEVKHKFTDFYADLLMAAYRKQRLEYIMETFSKKYYLSQDDCRREIKHALNVLTDWNIVLREDEIASR